MEESGRLRRVHAAQCLKALIALTVCARLVAKKKKEQCLVVLSHAPVVTSRFEDNEFFRLQGTTLKLSTSYHPQTDVQTEIVNKCLGNYLRCFAQGTQKNWTFWLPRAEFCYNTTWHAFIKMTPFEAVYGVPPPRLLSYIPGTTRVEAMDEVL